MSLRSHIDFILLSPNLTPGPVHLPLTPLEYLLLVPEHCFNTSVPHSGMEGVYNSVRVHRKDEHDLPRDLLLIAEEHLRYHISHKVLDGYIYCHRFKLHFRIGRKEPCSSWEQAWGRHSSCKTPWMPVENLTFKCLLAMVYSCVLKPATEMLLQNWQIATEGPPGSQRVSLGPQILIYLSHHLLWD